MSVDELRKLLKENRKHFYTYWSKQKLIELANINNLFPKEEPKKEEPKKEEEEKPKYVNYERLRNIRNAPIKVILTNVETKEEQTFPSIYKAAQFLNQSPQTVRYWGKKKGIWNKKCKVLIE